MKVENISFRLELYVSAIFRYLILCIQEAVLGCVCVCVCVDGEVGKTYDAIIRNCFPPTLVCMRIESKRVPKVPDLVLRVGVRDPSLPA